MTITVVSDLVYHLLGVGHSRPIQISNLSARACLLTDPTNPGCAALFKGDAK